MTIDRVIRFSLTLAIFMAASRGDAYQITGRWSSTVLNGSVGPRGNPVMVTWSIVDDGTPIDQGGNSNGSGLVGWLDDMFNVAPPPVPTDDYRDRPWFFLFQDSFDRIGELAGVTYVYEPHDDGVITGTSGSYGRRGDVRITGKSLGQGSTALAVNFFPNHSDMVINTDKTSFFDNTPNNYRGFRNVIMHEALHGLGITHVESSSGFLMDPFIQTHFDGPQLDEILALQRNYGDRLEKSGNDSAAGATNLHSLAIGGSARVGSNGSLVRVQPSQTDFVSIDGASDVDYYRFELPADGRLSVSLIPQGVLYNQGPQGGSQSPFDARAQSNLSLTLVDADGTSVLDQKNANGLGTGEFLGQLATAGTYFVRVAGLEDSVQLYDLQLSAAPFTTDLVWRGGVSNDWNVSAAPNFTAEGAATSFFPQDSVRFIDNQAPKIVDVMEAVTPASMVVDTTGRYILQGPGSIASGSLTKLGSGELDLELSGNSYPGATTVGEGLMLITGDANAMISPITIADGATLVMDASDAAGMASTFEIAPGGTLAIGRATSTANVFPDAPTSVLNNGVIRVFDDEGLSNLSGAGSLVIESEATTLAGTSAFTGDVSVNGGATLRGTAELPAAVTIGAGGRLEPGAGLGDLSFARLALDAAATLSVELGGTDDGAFDRLLIAEDAALAGTLEVSLTDAFTPAAGNVFEILTAQSLAGAFSAATFPTLPANLAWQLAYGAASVTLAVVEAGSPADFNGDGSVDGDDLLAWQAGVGKVGDAEQSDGDADGDGIVDGADFLAWQRELSSPAAEAAAVPEPGALALGAAFIAAGIIACRKRRQSTR